jgi:hypothetical protein
MRVRWIAAVPPARAYLRVAVQPFDLVLGRVAVAAVQLDGEVGDLLLGHFVREPRR